LGYEVEVNVRIGLDVWFIFMEVGVGVKVGRRIVVKVDDTICVCSSDVGVSEARNDLTSASLEQAYEDADKIINHKIR